MENEQGEDIVVDAEETNEEVEETTEEKAEKPSKPKRTPQEELEYFEGRAARLRKKLGTDNESDSKGDTAKAAPTERSSELDLGAIAYLNSMVGLKGKDEIALAREYIASGKEVLDLAENKFFKQDLQSLREARESADAIPKGKGRSGQTGVTDVDVAVAKFKETGKMPDDFKTRVAIKNKLVEEEKNNNMFSGPSVVGPQQQSY